VIWDVGLGAASNAMAALHCFEKVLAEVGAEGVRKVRVVSFEIDLDPLKLAAKHAAFFPHLRHSAPHALLENGRWLHGSGTFEWELHHGDFLEKFAATPAPDVIFYDPFSTKTDSALWVPEVFVRVLAHCGGKAAELFTYSSATAVRVALGVAWATLVASELIAAQQGLGALIQNASSFFQLDIIYVGIISIGTIALVMDMLLRRLTARLVAWQDRIA